MCARDAALITGRTAAVGASVFGRAVPLPLMLLPGEVSGTEERERSRPRFAPLQERGWVRAASHAAPARIFLD